MRNYIISLAALVLLSALIGCGKKEDEESKNNLLSFFSYLPVSKFTEEQKNWVASTLKELRASDIIQLPSLCYSIQKSGHCD